MFQLPTKFTGTNCERLSFSEFRKACFTLQQSGLFKVKQTIEHAYPNNYYEALIIDHQGECSLFQNCFVSYAGFGIRVNDEITFLDKPEAPEILRLFQFNINFLEAQLLAQPVGDEHLMELNEYEIKEVKHWLPQSIGGLLFSWYFD